MAAVTDSAASGAFRGVGSRCETPEPLPETWSPVEATLG
jgi:hypothetical protein